MNAIRLLLSSPSFPVVQIVEMGPPCSPVNGWRGRMQACRSRLHCEMEEIPP